MRTAFRRMTIAIAAVVALAFPCGCRKKKSGNTIIEGNSIFTTDSFPGAPVQNGNVAHDQRAMSPDREAVAGGTCVMNGDRGTAMQVWLSFSDGGLPPYHAYASYYDGETWTPPVHLAAADADFSYPVGVQVAFLNTSNHASEAARLRDGDAILVWSARDTDDDGAGTADGVNRNLFSTYFNVSQAGDALANYGFQPLGTRMSLLDRAGEDNGTVAIVTDGLCGEHRYGGGNGYRYGDDTTGIVVAWLSAEDNDTTDPGVEDKALWYSWFDPAAAGDPELPLVPSVASRISVFGYGASDTGMSSEETLIDDRVVVYNNLFFFRVASRAQPFSASPGFDLPATGLNSAYGDPMISNGDDVSLEYVAFNLGTGSWAGGELASAPKSSTTLDVVESNMAFLVENNTGVFDWNDTPSVYGSDEGLAAVEIYFVDLASDPDAVTDFGNQAIDSELRMAQIMESTGALDSIATISVRDTTNFDNIRQGDVSTRISRNGDYIWVMWHQPFAAGVFMDRRVLACQLTTTRPADDGTFVLPPVGTAISTPIPLSAEIDGIAVNWSAWQTALGYRCGVQSDPDVMNIAFQHATGADDQVFIAKLRADLSPTPVPAATVSLFETFTNGLLTDLNTMNNLYSDFIFTDAGANGDIVAAYVSDVDPTAALDLRLFSRRNGTGAGVVEIDSSTPVRQVITQNLRVAVTPPGSSIGVFDLASAEDSPDRPHAASFVHFIFEEANSTEDSGLGQALRTRRFNASDTSTTFAESFVPSAGTAFASPFQLSLPFVDPKDGSDARFVGMAISGDSVGVWFQELGHAYYQEVQDPGDGESTGWRVADGVTDPALVDDDSETEIFSVEGLYVYPCTCETLGGAILVWLKIFDVFHPNPRLQVRVRDRE